ncbi:hypothetical protein [Acinetobacter shaoyimingii]|uniref:Uncharacterized protein n=2 Tax=Acinetobacter shaoyimingii TaxID=2715164 RepID=A0A6G8RTG8_9GAMM|nr:hypothetical protein [Acinetobacter shaoyimingii]QIO05120.1 hypothetical protein G8E00_03610 [Acinetobacter shaoyimingii]
MFSNHKIKILILSSLLLPIQNIYAKQTDVERINIITKSTIGLFSFQHDNQDAVGIPLAAATANISEAEAKTLRERSGDIPSSTLELMLGLFKEQFNEQDFKIVAPALKRQFESQAADYQSCIRNGEIIKKEKTYEVPLICQLTVLDKKNIKIPKKTSTQSDAQFMVATLNLMTNAFSKAPKETLKTSILIHRVGEKLIPEMDDPNYFPSTVTNKFTGTTEEELMKENQK